MNYCYYKSPVGKLLIAGDTKGLRFVSFEKGNNRTKVFSDWVEDQRPLKQVINQLNAYFKGTLTKFDLKIAPVVTPFQTKVLRALRTILYGQTCSYADIARKIGKPTASRAVGMASGRNPISIVIPCHRVIGADGSLTGFGGGLPTKKALLGLESKHTS
ncbi:MAG: methylated-DNA-[protein]-cysteine S-methyltransferase [Lysobacterales bacterium]|jgi:methylated-DNA-[protein]-cysteine S-methyltransferase